MACYSDNVSGPAVTDGTRRRQAARLEALFANRAARSALQRAIRGKRAVQPRAGSSAVGIARFTCSRGWYSWERRGETNYSRTEQGGIKPEESRTRS